MTIGKGASKRLSLPIGDPTLRQIVGRKLDSDLVAGNNTDEVLAHPARHVGGDDVSPFNLDAKSRVRESLGYDALDFESLLFLFCHRLLLVLSVALGFPAQVWK
jgi:hypothetical protein